MTETTSSKIQRWPSDPAVSNLILVAKTERRAIDSRATQKFLSPKPRETKSPNQLVRGSKAAEA